MFEKLGPADGINAGGAGIILGLASIDQACGTWGFSEDIERGAKWLASQPPSAVAHGFFTGNAGVAVALSVAGRRFGCTEWIRAAYARLTTATNVQQDCDLFSGVAGVLWATCLFADVLGDNDVCQLASHCGSALIRLAEIRDDLMIWPSVEPGDPPLTGAAHGAAGIALALAVWGRKTGRSEALDLAIETFQRLFQNGRLRDGTMLRRALDGAKSCAPIQSWCHGIAGYLWCMLLAFGDDHRLKTAIDWSVQKCAEARSVGSPVYCHGVAGELELWSVVGRHPRLAEGAAGFASRAASVLRLQMRRKGALAVWGADEPETISPDLWVGFLGPANALALHARRINDPLFSGAWLRTCSSPRS
jgi:lantibiotic modifying enzyme